MSKMNDSPLAELIREINDVMDKIDDEKEILKSIYQRIKKNGDVQGHEPGDIRKAVSLMRKGPSKTVRDINGMLAILREIGDQDAISAAWE